MNEDGIDWMHLIIADFRHEKLFYVKCDLDLTTTNYEAYLIYHGIEFAHSAVFTGL